MAITDYYIDTTSGSDSTGTGSSSAPWKTTQKALNTITQGAGGDRLNYINSAADDVLSATLSLATYGTPATAKPLIFFGNGVVGGISGNNGGFTILTSTAQGISFQNMHLHHCGAAAVLNMSGTNSGIVACEIDNATVGVAVQVDYAIACYLHDLVSNAIWLRCTSIASSGAYNCRLVGANSSTMLFVNGFAEGNEVVFTSAGAGTGIGCNSRAVLKANSVYGAGGTGIGISDGSQSGCIFLNNIAEGFSGAGGINFKSAATLGASAGNRSYNGTTGFSYGTVVFQGTDHTDSASNFNSAGTGDLSLVTGSPARAASYPGTYPGSPTQTSYRDAGALQHQDAGGGTAGALLVGPSALVTAL